MASISMGAVYGYLKQPVKGLYVHFLLLDMLVYSYLCMNRWSPGKHPSHTIHAEDVAAAFWACAQWMAGVGGRAKADELAGEEIPFHNDKSKAAEISEMVSPDHKVVAPLFNVEDDGQFPLVEVATRIAKAFGTTFGFFNFLVNTMAKVRPFRFCISNVDLTTSRSSSWRM